MEAHLVLALAVLAALPAARLGVPPEAPRTERTDGGGLRLAVTSAPADTEAEARAAGAAALRDALLLPLASWLPGEPAGYLEALETCLPAAALAARAEFEIWHQPVASGAYLLKRARASLTLEGEEVEALRRRLRAERDGRRAASALRLGWGAGALLLAFLLYARLDERTGGYLRPRLRLACLALAAALTLVGWWGAPLLLGR